MDFKGLLLLAAGIVVVSSMCDTDDGWVEFQDSCLRFSKDSQSWDSAETHCRLSRSYLTAIETSAKMKFVENFLRSLHNQGHTTHWLGARDFVIEGSWRWLKTGFGVTYTNWGPDQPDDTNGSQNCLLTQAFNNTIAWADDACRNRHYYICEKPHIAGSAAPSVG